MSLTIFRKLPEKTCCPKSNGRKAFFRYLNGLKAPKMYNYLAPPFGHT